MAALNTEQCRRICELTQQYMEWMIYRICGDYAEVDRILDPYTKPTRQLGELSLSNIYEHFLFHAQNKSYGGNAIKKVFGSREHKNESQAQAWRKLQHLLGEFNPHYVTKTFRTLEDLTHAIKTIYNLSGMNDHVQAYILSIIELGYFLAQFKDERMFYSFVNDAYEKNRTDLIQSLLNRSGLYKRALSGLGEALLRDALKELGYVNYAKPDVHIRDIALLLKLASEKTPPREIAVMVEEIALNGKIMTPYHLDKFFYLIGSGDFYEHDTSDAKWKLFSKQDSIRRKAELAEFIMERLQSPPPQPGDQVALLTSSYVHEGVHRGRVGTIEAVDAHALVSVTFANNGEVSCQKCLFPTEFVVLQVL